MVDLFEFWSEISSSAKVHPQDAPVLDRVDHRFDLRCLPAGFDGPLRTAPVILLFLSPGFDESDVADAESPKGQERYARRRKGFEPLTSPEDHKPGWKWWSSRTSFLGPWQELRDRVAILNIGAYHSRIFSDEPLLAALPSSRVALDWAQTVLFPSAERGDRVVICMRAARFWGLDKHPQHGAALFAPPVTRGGHMLHGPLRETIVETARKAIYG